MTRKSLQVKIAGSRLALPIVSVFTIAVWLLYGLLDEHWWLQFGCFVVSTYLMLLMTNLNALIRVYSRMISCSYLLLFCAACFLIPSVRGSLIQTCVVATWLILFQSYQDKGSAGTTYYAFLVFSLASMAYVHVLFFVPILWLLMATNIQSLSWRTWTASLLGLLTPYWLWGSWLMFKNKLPKLTTHFTQLTDFQTPVHDSTFSTGETAALTLFGLCAIIGIIHYTRKSFLDKIRTRMLFGFFIWIDLFSFAFLMLQPQHSDMLIRFIIISTAPLIAHFLALTATRFTNMVFCVLGVLTLFLIGYQLWTTSYLF
ncbi:MAG: hypothetical protein IJS95_02640 [Prevotella sp.]|nr:hypothetical protein [Prevotella sp.]